jgi:hypothetical protein
MCGAEGGSHILALIPGDKFGGDLGGEATAAFGTLLGVDTLFR